MAINLDAPERAYAMLIALSASLPVEVQRLHDAIVVKLADDAGVTENMLRSTAATLAAQIEVEFGD